MTYPYNTRYHPAMPAVEIALGVPEADFSLGPLPAIVDTGADITVVPREYLMRLQAPVVAGGYLRSLWGERQSVKIYEVNVRIGKQAIHQVEVASDPEGREILLGRNVLNQLNLQLNGPGEKVIVLPV